MGTACCGDNDKDKDVAGRKTTTPALVAPTEAAEEAEAEAATATYGDGDGDVLPPELKWVARTPILVAGGAH